MVFYRSRTLKKKNEVAKCLKYVLKILTLILDISWGILTFPLKLEDSVAKFLIVTRIFLEKDIAEPLMAKIMYLYNILTATYFFLIVLFSLFVGHELAFLNSKIKLLEVLEKLGFE